MMETIGTMTFYDPLTGLPNRQHFITSLTNALESASTVILALVSIRDLPEIKTFVDRPILDALLVHLAGRLQSISTEQLVTGRLSEGEFGLIIPSNTNSVLQVIDRLDQLVAKPLSFDERGSPCALWRIAISVDRNLSADLCSISRPGSPL